LGRPVDVWHVAVPAKTCCRPGRMKLRTYTGRWEW